MDLYFGLETLIIAGSGRRRRAEELRGWISRMARIRAYRRAWFGAPLWGRLSTCGGLAARLPRLAQGPKQADYGVPPGPGRRLTRLPHTTPANPLPYCEPGGGAGGRALCRASIRPVRYDAARNAVPNRPPTREILCESHKTSLRCAPPGSRGTSSRPASRAQEAAASPAGNFRKNGQDKRVR